MAKAISNLSTTWSNTSNIYTGIGLNVNGAAYNANSALIDLKLNSNSLMRLTSNGVLYINGAPVGAGSGGNVGPAFDAANAAFATANAAGGAAAAEAFNKANSANIVASSAYDKANSANVLAFNTGAGANAFLLTVIAGANTAVGAGANSYADTVGTSANAFASATIAGANTAVGTGANAFSSATIAGANTAVGTGANAFTSATIAGANTAVGTGANSYAATVGTSANAFASATIAGANTAVGTGANSYAATVGTSANTFLLTVIAGANTAVGTGANAFTSATIAGANTAVGTGANAYSAVVGTSANAFASATIAGANVITVAAFAVANNANLKANLAWDTANAAFATANSAGGGGVAAAFLRANVSIGLSSNDLVTFHTANSSNSGIANSSSYYSAGYEHWRAYDGLTGASDHWFSAATTGWIGYDFYESKSVTQYAITGVSSGYGTNRSPTAWTFEGSDDGITWTVLDTISAQTWSSLEVKTFNIGNANNYFRYRVNVTTPVSGPFLGAAEINLRGFTQKATGAFNRANLASNTVNTIGSISNSAFNKANSANIVASAAYGGANLSAKLTGADFTGGVKANSSASYALQGYSSVNHGTHGQSTHASYGGVIGYAANGLKYGILGYANADALNGNGNIRIVHGDAGLYDSGKVLRIHNTGQYVAYANGTSVNLGSTYTTASYVLVYEANSGSSAAYFVGYNYVIKLANSPPGYTFANTDTATSICLFCSGHTLTLKNTTGAALNMSVAIYSAYGVG